MSMFLSDLLAVNILDTYKIVSGKSYLNRKVESIALLETPDFEKYVQERTLILTTLYPIKSNLSLFKKLLRILHQRHVAGLVVKLKRYIEVIPDDVVTLAEELHFPIITIDYDANLSEISTKVLHEIDSKALRTISLSSFYLDLVKTLDEKPKVDTILSFQNRFEHIDYWIYSQRQEKSFSTQPKLNKLAEEVADSGLVYQKLNDYYVYFDDIKLSNQLIYKVVFFARDEHRSKLYYYAEIIKMMLVFVYQKRQENSLQQNQFILENITNPIPISPNNESFIEQAELFGWNAEFPMNMVLLNIQSSGPNELLDGDDLRDHLLKFFELSKDQIRYLKMNRRYLFLWNAKGNIKLDPVLRMMQATLEKQHKLIEIKIAYTMNIKSIQDLSSSYATLNRGLNLITQRNVREKVFNEQSVKMFSILGKVSENELKEYVQLVLAPVLDYEKKHGGNLLDTMHMLHHHQYHLKKTKNALFVHYNTLRHRMQVLEGLGFGKDRFEINQYDLIFAVYIAKNLVLV